MKSGIYSVGIIIIEMLTGEKGCPDVGNVLASWSGRLEKSYEDTQLEQVRVCTEIGIACSDFDPTKRPVSTLNIIERLKETETTDEVSTSGASTVSRRLFVHPRVLYFSCAPNTLNSSSLCLTNYTDEYVTFRLSEKPMKYRCFAKLPLYGIVAPRSTHTLALTMNGQDEQFITLILESSTFGGMSIPTSESSSDGNEWHDFFEEVKMNAHMVQKVILEAVGTAQRLVTDELTPPEEGTIIQYSMEAGDDNCIDVHPNIQWILIGTTAGNVQIWNYEAQRNMHSITISTEKVVSVKFILRKDWFVAGSEDGFIHVYLYVTRMRRILSFKAHIKPLKSLAIHPTKPYLLSSSSHVMKLWDWDKGWEHIRTFKSKYPGSICQVAFNPRNTNSFVTASDNHIVEVWSLDSPQSEYTLSGHSDKVNCFDFFTHDDQQYLITGSSDCTAKIWNMHKKICTHTLHASMSPVTSVLFYRNLLTLVIGLKDGTVQLWSLTHFRLERIIDVNDEDEYSNAVWGLACFGEKKGFVIGIIGMVVLVDMEDVNDPDEVNDEEEASNDSEQEFIADKGLADTITKISPVDGELLAIQTRELRFTYQLNKANVCSLDLTNKTDERVVFILNEKEAVTIFANLPTCGIIPPRSTCTVVLITKEFKQLPEETNSDLILQSSISGDKYIVQFKNEYECHTLLHELRRTFNTVHEEVLRVVSCAQGDITPKPVILHGTTMYDLSMVTWWKSCKHLDILAAHPTETWILIGSSDGYNLKIQDLVSQEVICLINVPQGRSRMYSDLSVDEINTFTAAKYCKLVVKSFKFIVRKQWFLIGTSDGLIHVYSYGTKMEIQKTKSFRASKSYVTSIAIHPTQPHVLSIAEDGPIKLWNWDMGWECTQTFEDEHSRTIRQVTFDPMDTNSFASASSDHTIKIWSLHSRKSNYTLFGHLGEVNCLDFFTRGDQKYLISGSDDFSLRIYALDKRVCVHTIEDLMSPVISILSLHDRPYLMICLQDGTIHLWSSTHFEFERMFIFGCDGIVRGICQPGSGRVVIGRENNILIIDTDNISKERGNVVDPVNSAVVLEERLEDLHISGKHENDLAPVLQELSVTRSRASEYNLQSPPQEMTEVSEAEIIDLTQRTRELFI